MNPYSEVSELNGTTEIDCLSLQLFKEDPETGLTHVALSSDSTCVNNLYSSQDGYETLHMAKDEHRGILIFF